MSSRIHHPGLRSKVMSAAEAAAFIQHGTTVGMSGFTGSCLLYTSDAADE